MGLTRALPTWPANLDQTMRASLFLFLSLPLCFLACDGGNDTSDTSDTDTDTDTDTADTDTGDAPFCETPTSCVDVGGACALEGVQTEDLCLTKDKAWLLRGGVTIGDDVNPTTIKIEPGTTVYGESAQVSFLAIARHSKIIAEGTATAPIVFTSDQLDGQRGRGDWGGLAINGLATINGCDGSDPCEAEAEGGVGKYGGDNDADNSGIVKYVRLEFGGVVISTDNEINGFGLAGVGSGTMIDYVQIHAQNDDCIEFWGGTVSAKHIVCSLPGDDGIDWDFGWRGNMQHALVIQDTVAGNNGIEADNHESAFASEPVSNPTLSNLTLVGEPTIAASNYGTMLRRGTSGHLTNVAITGFSKACLSIRDQQTYDNFATTSAIDHTMMACAKPYEESADEMESMQEEDVFEAELTNAIEDDLMLTSVAVTGPDLRPKSGSPLLGAGQSPSGAWWDAATYVGAFDATTDWTAGWTSFPSN